VIEIVRVVDPDLSRLAKDNRRRADQICRSISEYRAWDFKALDVAELYRDDFYRSVVHARKLTAERNA